MTKRFNTSNIMKNAWAFAREMAKLSPGTTPRDWVGYGMKTIWKDAKMSPDAIVAKNLPIVTYQYGEKDGGDPISIFVSSSHDSGSGTFWLENRGKGGGGQDDLDPNEYNENWEDGSDYTISEAMQALSEAETLGDGVIWVDSISKPVYEDLYNNFILYGGNTDDLMDDD